MKKILILFAHPAYHKSRINKALINAIKEFEKRIDYFDVQYIRKHAETFNRTIFEEKIKQFVSDKLSNFIS